MSKTYRRNKRDRDDDREFQREQKREKENIYFPNGLPSGIGSPEEQEEESWRF